MEWFKKIIEMAADKNGSIEIEVLIKEFNREFGKNAVIKSRYDELLAENEKIKTEIKEKNDILAQYEKIDIQAMKDEIEALKQKQKDIIKDNAIDLALIKAGARNIKAAKALIELDGDFDENLLNEQIKNLAQDENSSFLFSKNSDLSGFMPAQGESENEKSIDEMSYSEMCRYLENNI